MSPRYATAMAASLTLAVLLSGPANAVALSAEAASPVCHVSNTSSRPVPGRPSFNFGNARIAVAFPIGARFVAVPDGSPGWAFMQRNGWIRVKLGWFTARGTPHVTGRRTDRTGRALHANVAPLSATSDGSFYPSLLYFPSLGCWRITARAGGAHLTATVNLVRSTHRR